MMENNIQEHIDNMARIQDYIINYIDCENDIDDNFNKIKELNLEQNDKKLRMLLHFILKIANNRLRTSNFFNKIENIILLYKDQFVTNFSNFNIFNIVKSNKRVLLIFIENEIITVDQPIFNYCMDGKYLERKYIEYFIPEFEQFMNQEDIQKYKENTKNEINMYDDNFEQSRKNSENISYLCLIIRKDLLDEFIDYTSHSVLKLSTKIPNSIFETNSLLLKNEPTLIEYAAFFGSVNIFKYLIKLNDVQLKPSSWIYAVHSNNSEIVHLFEDLNIILTIDLFYEICIIGSIKCYYNSLLQYFLNQYLEENENEPKQLQLKCLQYYYYYEIPVSIIGKEFFCCLCKYGYYNLVEIFLNINNETKNFTEISKYIFFNDEFEEIKINSLKKAISKGNDDIVKLLLSKYKSNANQKVISNFILLIIFYLDIFKLYSKIFFL